MQFRGGRFANLPTILIHAPSEKAAMPTSGWSDARKRISKQPTESLAPAEERAKAELNVSSTNYALAGAVILMKNVRCNWNPNKKCAAPQLLDSPYNMCGTSGFPKRAVHIDLVYKM